MGKKQKFSNDLLLTAVVKYAEIEKNKKIIGTELAEWARKNIPGLEEVRDYHFLRSEITINQTTRKKTERPRECKIRIDEINRTRSITVSLATNLLLHGTNIEDFLSKPKTKQIEAIREARKLIETTLTENIRLKKKNEALSAEKILIQNMIKKQETNISNIFSNVDTLTKKVKFLLSEYSEEKAKEKLAEMGLKDGEVDLVKNIKCLTLETKEVLNFNREIAKYYSTLEGSEDKNDNYLETEPNVVEEKSAEISAESILKGINFE